VQYNLFGGEHLATAQKWPPSRAWTSLWALNEVRIFRSFPPHIHPHFIYLFSPRSSLGHLFCLSTANRMPHPSYSDLGSKAQLFRRMVLTTAWIAAPSRGVTGALVCAGLVPGQPAHEETCPTPQFSCFFMTPPYLWPSLDLISSAATLSSLHFLRTSPHIFYYFTPFHLTLPARHAQPPAAVPIPTPPAAPFPSTPAPTPSHPRRHHHAIRPR
jgi:hypothetical protein